jgi:hypothetical protein
MKMKFLTATLLTVLAIAARGQDKTDTVIVSLAKTSKVVFTIQDRSDLEILKHYNFQELFSDIITRLEEADTLTSDTSHTEPVAKEEDWSPSERGADEDDDDDEEWDRSMHRHRGIGRTWQSTNVDLGTNNYLADGQFPDDANLYTVRPWGSWYVGLTSIQRTRVGRNFFFEWGLGVSWYNFKFQEDNIVPVKADNDIQFTADARDLEFIKSKLSATYINVSFVPLLDFGDHGRKPRVWDGYGSEFRMGIGPYAGYRIGSKSKLVYNDEDGDREREKNRDSFYLNNLRYGARLQVGFRSTDFFFNYDFNELFAKDKGPKLNAISFGVIF